MTEAEAREEMDRIGKEEVEAAEAKKRALMLTLKVGTKKLDVTVCWRKFMTRVNEGLRNSTRSYEILRKSS